MHMLMFEIDSGQCVGTRAPALREGIVSGKRLRNIHQRQLYKHHVHAPTSL